MKVLIIFEELQGKNRTSRVYLISCRRKSNIRIQLFVSCLRLLGEEIDIYLSTGKLPVKYPNSDSLFLSENVDTPTKVSENNDDLIYDLYDSQASTDENNNPKNEDRFSDMEQRSDMLHNFFLKEISDLRREMKDLIQTKETAT